MDDKNKSTQIVRAGVGTDPAHKSVMPPLYLSSTYEIEGLEQRGVYEYSRTKNPTRDELADALSDLEGGIGCAVTSSGMAALTLILHQLGPEDLIFAPYDCYGRSYWLLRALAEKKHFKLKFIDCYNDAALDTAFSEHTPNMVLIESPSNPVMRIADIKSIAARANQCGAKVVCDNTFLSPILQRPFDLGADIIFHSTTKFINGHSDVVGGAVIVKDNQELLSDLHLWNNSLGTIGAPFDSYMTLRGLRTLELRVQRAQENTIKIANFLEGHPKVKKVYYPGLSSHEAHELASKQQNGPGAMLSFELKGSLSKFLSTLKLFSLAQSLGGTESLINHPASMTHVSMGADARAEAGVSDNLLRLSIGIEHIDDLLTDLDDALKAAC
ncbi:MAG: O-succinylhomoserine (thiol)-lyase [Micavibrio sp. TMED27]|nr:O-succinylhomoserine (thiol)-lyase [Micavibrio sp.]OUT90770.1 MAG: O-succinylhomoserine (thiol)-lyase [Micavibrio sp. TMED27]|tara:strand:- start:750 stop:1901 length:1152 start_codon:yes stop_codon:yes gene_type:complete